MKTFDDFNLDGVGGGGGGGGGGPAPLLLNVDVSSTAWAGSTMGVTDGSGAVNELIRSKHREYVRLSRMYRILYYVTRLIAALGAALIPFVIAHSQQIATSFSIAVVVALVLDQVFAPKDKWRLYSKATDLLTVARLKQKGEYNAVKDVMDVLVRTESDNVEQLKEIEEIVRKVQETPPAPPPSR